GRKMMADPQVVPCPADAWTKVATSVLTGVIHIHNNKPSLYLQTYRDTGGAAPTNKDDALPFNEPLIISDSNGIDVYVRPVDEAGSVRVDL
ncbi:hypothetical protein KAU11_10105, partial [Candidatus Babeliales bacterium]|nr:hypothetical protein [Candidatus Babeliales bacterium]